MSSPRGLLIVPFLWALSGIAAEDDHQGEGHEHKHGYGGKSQAEKQSILPVGIAGPIIPPPTDADRAAAFPDVGDHQHMMDTPVLLYALLDQFEWVNTEHGPALRWEGMGWLGDDEQRLWLRTEGERIGGTVESAELHLLYGQPVARWWDLVAGLRHDFRPTPSRTSLAFGVQGLAPYWFETEATFYIGETGQTGLRLEFEYELLLTNHLILQPLLELNFYGEDDLKRGVGSGLATSEVSLRLRYEIRREIAPYIGITWDKSYGDTADLMRHDGESIADLAFLAGIRLWF